MDFPDHFLIIPETRYIQYVEGHLVIYAGYAWDGCSGPTVDTKSNMRASLVHDCLYQCIREGFLPSTYREEADLWFDRIAKEDGMGRIRRWYYLKALRTFGWLAVKSGRKKKRAP